MIGQLNRFNPSIYYLLLFSLVFLLYIPALDSVILLDDQLNLSGLNNISQEGYLPYVIGGSAGPAGRPLSLLSFALQHESWPGDPVAFKLVNLLIHGLNGFLVFLLAVYLSKRVAVIRDHYLLFSLAITGVWMIHPLHMSTVLYIVQRMTLLASSFMLISILAFVYLLDRTRNVPFPKRLVLLAMVSYTGMLLAILCKETGILIPCYLLVVLFTLRVFTVDAEKKVSLVVLLIPLFVFVIYLLGSDIQGSYYNRPFTPAQRLLTEANILLEYLKLIVFPTSNSYSVFHDDYPVASGILIPG
ncbi:MAG: hypothetical protein MI865_09565, partial [Proteobacteria bacterium]|nr:hypothetical protein [Pseudomonadota bacterium]